MWLFKKRKKIYFLFAGGGDSLLSMDLLLTDDDFDDVESVEQAEENIDENNDIDDNEQIIDDPTEDQESVDDDTGTSQDDGDTADSDKEVINNTSPKSQFYSSTLKALKDDGVLPDLDDDFIKTVGSPEDFATAIEKQVAARLDEKQRIINEALNGSGDTEQIVNLESTVSYLNEITDDSIEDESEDGETLRKNLIYQDYINKGFSEERAQREVDKSFKAGNDVEDAKLSLESNKDYFKSEFDKVVEENKRLAKEKEVLIKENVSKLKTKVLDTEEPVNGVKVDKITRSKIFESITKPIVKLEDGRLITELQKYTMDNPVDSQYYFGLFYNLTDGFKNIDKLVKTKVSKQVKSHLLELESKLQNSSNYSESDSDLFNQEANSFDYTLDI